MELLRDHGIRAAGDLRARRRPDDEASVVLFSMVCELERGRLWVAPGNPCETPYEEVDLTGLAEGR